MQNDLEQISPIADKPIASHVSVAPARGESEKSSLGRRIAILLIAVAVISLAVTSGILPRLKARKALAAETSQLAAPTVTVVQPHRGAPTQEIILPGNIQAFVDAPIYARTNGYLKRWYFDIGSPVKQGQLLAEIESPEVDQQLSQAQADLGTAMANLSSLSDHRRPLIRPHQAGCRLATGDRQRGQRSCLQKFSGKVGPGKCGQA